MTLDDVVSLLYLTFGTAVASDVGSVFYAQLIEQVFDDVRLVGTAFVPTQSLWHTFKGVFFLSFSPMAVIKKSNKTSVFSPRAM